MKYNIDITELWRNDFGRINTPDGFQKIKQLVKKTKNCVAVLFDNGDIIECAVDHKFESYTGEWISAEDSLNMSFLTSKTPSSVIDIKHIGIRDVYDLEVGHKNHRYYSESISSHNTGKTSMCHTIIEETGADALFLNASLYPNIDILRSKIQGFVSTSSFDGNPKIVVLDEADFLNANSTQPALRGFIESFSKNARFILTCNYPQKIIEPLRNRLINVDFDDMANKNKAELIKATFLRSRAILEKEKIEYTTEDLKWIVRHFYPSSRLILNKIAEFTTNKVLTIDKDKIDTDSLNSTIIKNILNKNFEELRRNCTKLPDPSSLFLTLFENIDIFEQPLRPSVIMIIAKYQSYDSLVRDRLINVVAMGTEIIEIL